MQQILDYITDRSHRLDEALSRADVALLKQQLSYPDVRPCTFDESFEAWLYRIGLWGKVEIVYNDPEFKVKNRTLTQAKFIEKVTNDAVQKILGKWSIDRKEMNRVELYREYVGMTGKKYRESFMVTVELKPELKKAM
jgi:hypothetical protein